MTALSDGLFVLALGLLGFYFYGPHRQYWIDYTRFELFVIRDRLFLDAFDLGIPFDHRAYTDVRSTLNAHIRRLETRTALTDALIVRSIRRAPGLREEPKQHFAAFDAALAELDGPRRRAVQRARNEMHLVMLRYLAYTSLPLYLVVRPLYIAVRLLGLGSVFLRRADQRAASVYPVIDLSAEASERAPDHGGPPLHAA